MYVHIDKTVQTDTINLTMIIKAIQNTQYDLTIHTLNKARYNQQTKTMDDIPYTHIELGFESNNPGSTIEQLKMAGLITKPGIAVDDIPPNVYKHDNTIKKLTPEMVLFDDLYDYTFA